MRTETTRTLGGGGSSRALGRHPPPYARGATVLGTEPRARILAARATGATWYAIAAQLNYDQVPAPAGGRWWPATVHRVADPEGHALTARARRARWQKRRGTDA